MQKIVALLIIILSFCLCSCSNVMVSDQLLSKDKLSAKDVVQGVEPYIKGAFKTDDYHLGEIHMNLNENHRGTVRLTYTKGVFFGNPVVYEAVIDTQNGRLDHISKLGSDSKLDPGIINFSTWKVDSMDAYNITAELFESIPDFQCDKVIIRSNNRYKLKYEIWVVELYNSSKNKQYWSEIDPITGEVYDSGVQEY